jgi:hypothetical protein
MTSQFIRSQVLTLTKAQDERAGALRGIALSTSRFGFEDPPVVYSDDPVKVKLYLSTV